VDGTPVPLCFDCGGNTDRGAAVTCGGVWGSCIVYVDRIQNASYTCVLCNKLMFGHGNNPCPAAYKGKCCNICNFQIVLPQRLGFAVIKEQLNECEI
jgi:hypothetical protein